MTLRQTLVRHGFDDLQQAGNINAGVPGNHDSTIALVDPYHGYCRSDTEVNSVINMGTQVQVGSVSRQKMYYWIGKGSASAASALSIDMS